MINLRSAAALLLFSASVISSLPSVRAQEQQPEESPAAERGASVRVWIFPGSEREQVEVTFSAGEQSEKRVAARAVGGVSSSDEGYQPVPEGQLLTEIRVGDRVVLSTTVSFRNGSGYTMVVWNSGGKWQAKLFLDTSLSAKSERHVRVINFAEGREALLRIDGAKPSPVAGSAVAEIPAPAGVVLVNVEVLDPTGGAPALSSVEIDFSMFLNSYVVIAPDYRGRMRPRVIGGGRTKASLSAEAEATAPPVP